MGEDMGKPWNGTLKTAIALVTIVGAAVGVTVAHVQATGRIERNADDIAELKQMAPSIRRIELFVTRLAAELDLDVSLDSD